MPKKKLLLNLENWEFLGGVLYKLSTARSIHIKHLTPIYFSVHFFLLIKSIKDLPPSTGLHFSCVIHIMTVRVDHMQRCLCCDHEMNINISCFSFGWWESEVHLAPHLHEKIDFRSGGPTIKLFRSFNKKKLKKYNT